MDQTTEKDAAEKAAPAERTAAAAPATDATAPRSRFRQLEPATDGDRIRIEARDDSAGAYRLAGFDGGPSVDLRFQQGDAAEVGTNGVSPSHLLAVVADRLRQQQQQAGDKPEKAHAQAVKHIEAALAALAEGGPRAGQDRAQARAEEPARGSMQHLAPRAAAGAPTAQAAAAQPARAAAQPQAAAPAAKR